MSCVSMADHFREAGVDGSFDGTIATDASDTGFGGWVSLEGQTRETNLSVLAENIRKQAGLGFSAAAAQRLATTELEVLGPLPSYLQGDRASSTLREIFGAFELISLLSNVLSGGRFRMHFDNMSCVMGLGGRVPPSATGGKEPKSVLGGSRVDDIQTYIIKILDLALERNIELVAIWVPRAENERSDLLSRTSELARAEYWMSDAAFARIDDRWGRHSLDAFSMPENVRVTSGRFMSKFYNSKSTWVDSLSCQSGGRLTRSSGRIHRHAWWALQSGSFWHHRRQVRSSCPGGRRRHGGP